MANDQKAKAIQFVRQAWQSVYAEVRHLDSTVTMRPSTFADIFVIQDDVKNGIHFNIGPVVLSVPQKKASNRTERLYVVIKGELVFESEMRDEIFTTRSFATNIGYFRESGAKFEHVYGAHFDFDPRLVAHPVFHSQITTNADLFEEVRKYHHHTVEHPPVDDFMNRLLRNVRQPTAQMDFFAVLLQVCSDHLINKTSGKPEHSHYDNIKKYCSFFRSYGDRHTGLQASIAAACHRSHFWYDHPQPTKADAAK